MKKVRKLFTIIMTVCLVFSSMGMMTYAAEANSATVELKATKVLEGGELEDGQFTFKIEPVGEAPAPEKLEATNDADGNISFGCATFTAAGTYEYKVAEIKGDDETITYDEEVKTITVTVTEQASGGGGGFTPTVHVGEGEAMQWLKSYPAEGEEVKYDKGESLGGAATYKTVTDEANGGTAHVFCLVEEVSSGTDNGQDRKTRHKSNAGVPAGGTYLDAVIQVQNNVKPGVAPSTDAAHVGLQMLFLAGYPYNQANLKGDLSDQDFYKATQWALWGFMHGNEPGQATTQRDSSGSPELYDKLLEYARGGNGAGGLWLPESGITMYIYWPGGNGSADYYQPMINAYLPMQVASTSLSAEATTVEFKNTKDEVEKPEAKMATTVSVDGEASSADAAVEVEEGEKDVVDTITYEGLTPGATYKVTGTLMDVTDGEPKEVANASAECVADESGNGTWEIVFKSAKLEAGKTYVVFEEAVNVEDADDCAEHKDANDLAQTIVVKESEEPPAEEETTPPPPEVPSTSLDDEPTADNKTPEKTEKTTTPSSNNTPTQSRTTAPRTGDETNIMLWVALVAIAGASTTGLVLKKKRVRNK